MPDFAFVLPSFANFLRPLLGLGLLAALAMVFKPLIIGFLRAALLVLKPRQSQEQRKTRNALHGVRMLNHMAKEVDATQPSLASELRMLAARGA
jgi:hypothetical protein